MTLFADRERQARRMAERAVRVAEIRQENAGGDVGYADIEWLCCEVLELQDALAYTRHLREKSSQRGAEVLTEQARLIVREADIRRVRGPIHRLLSDLADALELANRTLDALAGEPAMVDRLRAVEEENRRLELLISKTWLGGSAR